VHTLTVSDNWAICVYCRCFSDVKTAVLVSIATGLSTPLDLEILLENSGSVRLVRINAKTCLADEKL